MAWKDLSMSDKSQWMRFFIKNGITDAKQMSEHYNSFAEGGDKDKPPLAWKGRFVNAGRPQVSGININPFSLKETSYKGVEPDGRLSDEKFNWFRNWYYNRNNQVRKNSILSLHNFNVNKSMAYADNVPIVKDNATFNKYLDDNQKEAFNRSSGNPFLLGYYQPRIDSFKTANRLNPYIIAADDNDTDIHEFTHALQYQGGIAPTKAIESYSYDKNNTYLDDPREIYARLMQMRYRNKLDPKKIWTKEQINALKKDKNFQDVDILNRYDDDMLLYLFNEVADNNTTTELPNYAALGGRLFYNG